MPPKLEHRPNNWLGHGFHTWFVQWNMVLWAYFDDPISCRRNSARQPLHA